MKELPQLTVLDLANLADLAYDHPPPTHVLGAETFVFESTATDTQGYCVNLKIHGKKVMVIVFRGSKGVRDWLRDLWLPSCIYKGRKHLRVHAMAQASWESVSSKVMNHVEAEAPERILITGHSLGGQLCTPCADDLYGFLGRFSTRVTFGALPFGKEGFSEYMGMAPYLKHLRFVLGRDIATFNLWHSVVFGYRHDALAIKLTPWWDFRRFSAHSLELYKKEIEKELTIDPYKWRIV